jgi:arginyl-tRNA synthetase
MPALLSERITSLMPEERSANAAALLDILTSLDIDADRCQTAELRRRPDSFADIRIFFKDRDWPDSAEGRLLVASLGDHKDIEAVRCKNSAILLRFASSFISGLGERLELGEEALAVKDLLPSRSYLVSFVSPNTSKALHIGHLRNIALGSALLGLLSKSGADVRSESLVGDIGRSACEALAGLEEARAQGITPEGQKADHFVGECYARYVSAHPHRPASGLEAIPGDPTARDLSALNDRADELLTEWLSGNDSVRRDWRKVRDVIMDGHAVTLDRLGVRIQQHDYESDGVDGIESLIARGLELGIFESASDGTVTYKTGRREFETLVIRRGGFPTEHARLMTVCLRLLETKEQDRVLVAMTGNEWKPVIDVYQGLWRRLRPEAAQDGRDIFSTYTSLFHGMVTIGDAKMASSDGGAVLIDHLLDEMAAHRLTRSMADRSGGAVSADQIAVIVAKAFSLSRPLAKHLEFSKNSLLDEKTNPAWKIARSWSRLAGLGAVPDAGDRVREEDGYRLTVIRALQFRCVLAQAALTLDSHVLANYTLDLCERIQAEPPQANCDRINRSVLGACLSGLNLLPDTH